MTWKQTEGCLSNGTEYKMLSKVREEAADVELVADVLLDKIYARV